MQETLSFKKVQLGIIAAAMAVLVAFGIGLAGTQQAYASDIAEGIPVGMTKDVKANGVTWQLKNVESGDGVTVVGVTKTTKKALKVPASVTVDGQTYNVVVIAKKAFANATKATKVTLPKTVKQIKKNAFTGSKIKTVVLKTTKLKKAKVKGSLKNCKVKTIKAPKAKVKAYKKIFKKANSGKKVTVKK